MYGSLQEPTLTNWSRVTHASVGSALIISAAFAVAGYATFTGYTQGIRTIVTVHNIYQLCHFMSIFRGHIRELLQE